VVEARERVLIVDDDDSVRLLLGHILEREGYRCEQAATFTEARASLQESGFDVLVCDVRLPDGSGLDLVEEAIAADGRLAALVVSGLDDVALGDRALRIGAYGYIVKPFSANDVLIGVLGALAHRRREQLARDAIREASAETIRRLCTAVEARDTSTAAHINGMSDHCSAIALELGLPPERCELLRAASPMHDVGKVGVADRILLKAGRLTADERAAMEQHAEIGYRILAGSRAELLQLAATVAWTHHERIDGRGYPRGLGEDEIPLEGRIAAVADVYDALTRDRVYRPRFSRERALEMLGEGRGTHFDPDVLDALISTLERAPVSSAESPAGRR
jgi:putative two-component system response regulator